jgi:hypothetical protein
MLSSFVLQIVRDRAGRAYRLQIVGKGSRRRCDRVDSSAAAAVPIGAKQEPESLWTAGGDDDVRIRRKSNRRPSIDQVVTGIRLKMRIRRAMFLKWKYAAIAARRESEESERNSQLCEISSGAPE